MWYHGYMHNGEQKQGLIEALMATVIVGFEAYFVLDRMTDGKLTDLYREVRSDFIAYMRKRAQYRKDVGNVLWQAIETVEGAS